MHMLTCLVMQIMSTNPLSPTPISMCLFIYTHIAFHPPHLLIYACMHVCMYILIPWHQHFTYCFCVNYTNLMWQEIVERLRQSAKEGRELSYKENAIGITALLHCPLKWELSKAYDLRAEAVEIDDGYVWERQVKDVMREIFGDSFTEEKDLIYEVDGYVLHGHLDVFVEKEDEVIGIELKAPKFIQLRGIPSNVNKGLYIDEEGLVLHNPVYLTQAMIQRLLLEKLYPHKKVRQFLFYKGLARYRSYSAKLYIVSEIKESIEEEELRGLIKAFHEDKRPRYPEECQKYCVFYQEGICDGIPYRLEETVRHDLVFDYLKEYRRLQGELKTIEAYLKKLIKGTITINGKTMGWVKRTVKEIDINKVLERLHALEKPQEYLTVKWQKKEELIQTLGQEIVKEEKEVIEWKI